MYDDTSQVQPIDALLAAYAAGTLSAPLTALVEAHLELKPESRRFVAALAALGGVLLDGIAPTPLRDRDTALAGALTAAPGQAGGASSRATQSELLPPSLLRLIGRDPKELAWHRVIPGLKECPIVVGPGIQASLMRIKAGSRMPAHTHTGQEVVLVLAGGFSDANGDYRRGDIEIADETFSHRSAAHRDRDCLFFVVRDGPVKLTGPIGRIIQLFRRDES
jgi:putative transcriptional regulator